MQSPGTGPSVFSYNQVTPGLNKNPNPYIENLTVNDSSSGVVASNKQYTSLGWNVFMRCELATVNLSIGTNVIKFTIRGDNINYCGIVVDSLAPITLGAAGSSEI